MHNHCRQSKHVTDAPTPPNTADCLWWMLRWTLSPPKPFRSRQVCAVESKYLQLCDVQCIEINVHSTGNCMTVPAESLELNPTPHRGAAKLIMALSISVSGRCTAAPAVVG
jgi:hypothetical protein